MNKDLKLKEEANLIIKELNLLKVLKEFGETALVGSVPLNLIVKLDIDIHTFIKKGSLSNIVNKVHVFLLNNPKIKKIDICDYKEKDSIKIGVQDFPGSSGLWSIDIWITKNRKTAGFEKTKEISRKLNPENRKIIMKMKKHYHKKKLLRDGLSTKIYNAILNRKIKTVKEFEKLLKTIS